MSASVQRLTEADGHEDDGVPRRRSRRELMLCGCLKLKNVSRGFATLIAVPMFVINLLFCLFTALVGFLFCADLLISLLYQFAMPTSAASSVSSLILLSTLAPWIVVFMSALADWHRWPIHYYRLHAILKRTFRRAARWALVPAEQRAEEDRQNVQRYRRQQSQAAYANTTDGGGDSAGNGAELMTIDANAEDTPAHVAEALELHWRDVREMMRYSSCLLIWLISLFVSLRSSFTGTWLFVVLTFAFIIANALFDFERLEMRPLEKGAGVYIMYRPEALTITIYSLTIALLTLTAVVSRVEADQLGGGVAAVALAYTLTLLVLAPLVFVRLSGFRGWFRWEVFRLGGLHARVLGGRDVLLLLVASIMMFATTDAESGGAVLAIAAVVGLCHVAYGLARREVRLQKPLDVESESDDEYELAAVNAGALDYDAQTVPATPSAAQSEYRRTEDEGSDLVASGAAASRVTGNGVVDYGVSDTDGGDAAEPAVSKRDPLRQHDTRKALRRVAYSAYVFFTVFVFGTSLIDTSGKTYPLACPGTAPGISAVDGRFGLCDTAYPPSNFSTVDFIALTAVSYMEYAEKARGLEVFFPNRTAFIDDVASSEQHDSNSNFIGVNFTVIRFPRQRVTVVTVRGSFTSVDWLQDLYIMSDTLAIQIGKAVLPLPLSDSVAASLVALGGSFKFGMKSYTQRVEAAIDLVRRTRPEDTVFVAGHSLGGFTANVVAARTRTRSVTMSPIGTGYTYKRYDFERSVADKYQVSLIPEGDLVPKIDEQLGLQQFFVTTCTIQNAWCHALSNTLSTISHNCGDPAGRRIVFSTDELHC